MLDVWLNSWHSMDRLAMADIAMLALMFVNAAVIILSRCWRYDRAFRQSRAFVRDSTVALCEGRLGAVLSIADRKRSSHVAAVVAASLSAFASTPLDQIDTEAIDAAKRAGERSRRLVTADLSLGLGTLATIASSAPFIGLLGTVLGILNSFQAFDMSKSAMLGIVAFGLAGALISTGAGLMVAIPATWCRNYLLGCMEVIEAEMSNASLETITYLHAHRELRTTCLSPEKDLSDLSGAIFSKPESWEVKYDRHLALLPAMCCCAGYIVLILVGASYRSYIWAQNAAESEYVGGQVLLSPDQHYRAAVPIIYREQANSSHTDGISKWSCGPGARTAVTVVPNDRPPSWKPRFCAESMRYEFESDGAALTWNCEVPVIMWRTSDELIMECSDCSADNVQLVRPGFFPNVITVLGAHGKRIYPGFVDPEAQCSD